MNPLKSTNVLQCLFQKSKHTKVQIIQQKPKPQFLPLLQFLVLYLSIPNTKLTLLSEYNIPKSPNRTRLYLQGIYWYSLYNNSPLHSHNMDTKASDWGILVYNSYISSVFSSLSSFANNSAAGVTKPANPCNSDGIMILVAFPSATFSKASKLFIVKTA